MKRLICSFSVIFILVSSILGNIRFSVSTERTKVVLGEQIVVTATVVSTKELKNISHPPLQSTPYFTVAKTSRNQQQSSSIQIVNGKMTQNVQITYLLYYHLAIKKEGSFTFPSLTFKYDNKTYSSRPFTINVGKEPAKSNYISVHISLNKKNIYKDEQGILTAQVLKKPQAPIDLTNEGFMTILENIEKTFGKTFSINRLFTNRVAQSQKNIKGQVYQVFSLSFSVIPLKTGKITLPPVPYQYNELQQVSRRGRDMFDDFFGGSFFGSNVRRIPRTAYSNRLTVNVKPLPPPPSDFTGAVGTFSLNAKLSEHSVPAGDAVTLNITLRGSTRPGNMADIKLPDFTSFEVFKPEKRTSIDTTAKGISSRKQFKYLVIPQEEGDKIIPSVNWTYFNPQKGTYKTLSTGVIPSTVTKGKKGKKQSTTRYLTQSDIREIGQDIRYVKMTNHIKNQSLTPYKNPLFLILYPLPFLIALFTLLYRIQATALKKDPKVLLRKKALNTARVEVKNLKKEFSQNIPKHALTKIAEITEHYISHRFGFVAAGKTLEELKEELTKLNIENAVTDSLIPFLEKLDSYRFTGVSVDKNILLELLDKALSLIEELEKKEKKL